jgi:hypothetical protein
MTNKIKPFEFSSTQVFRVDEDGRVVDTFRRVRVGGFWVALTAIFIVYSIFAA